LTWKDYWRFSPDAYRVLFDEKKFEVLVTDGWGSADAVRVGWETSDIGPSIWTTPIYQAIERKLFEKNDRINYIVTWCIARKKKTINVKVRK
jgi:hypothetical protein